MATRTTVSNKKRASGTSKKASTSKKSTAGGKAAARKPAAARAKPTTRKKKPQKASTAKAGKGAGSTRRSTANVVSGPGLGKTYKSGNNEEYMNRTQLEHFREKLMTWKDEIQRDLLDTMNHLREDATQLADPNDRASQESEFALELRTRDRERKLLRKIEQALGRIEDGSYGYCEETGDEIGIARLEIRPVATLCVEAQERREQRERQFADNR